MGEKDRGITAPPHLLGFIRGTVRSPSLLGLGEWVKLPQYTSSWVSHETRLILEEIMPIKRLFHPICTMFCISQIALADKLCSLKRGTYSIMYLDLACESSAYYAQSHLSHSGPSESGLPLFCQSVEQLKRDLPLHVRRSCSSLAAWVACEKNVHSLRWAALGCARERGRRETVTYGLLITFPIRGQSTSSIKYCITASHLDLYCHNDY